MDEKQLFTRAANFMAAAICEPDNERRQVLAETASAALVDVARLRSSMFGDFVPVDAILLVRRELMARMLDHFTAVAKAAAPALAEVTDVAEITRIWAEALAASSPVK